MRTRFALGSIALTAVTMLPWAFTVDAAEEGSMDIRERHEIERACERSVYTFLRLFEGEQSKTADLFTENGSVQFLPGAPKVGRETIREEYSRLETVDTNLNVLIASNLLITAIDENNAAGFCYVTHFRHEHADSKREEQGVLRAPNSITGWSWEFRRVEGEWKISTLHAEVVLISEDLMEALEAMEAASE